MPVCFSDYDLLGNRLTQTSEGKTLSYSYNNLNQLTSIKEGNTTVASYTYDANGNQKKEVRQHVSVTVGGNTQVYNKETDYVYDLRGLLTGVSVKTPSANETTGAVTYNTQTTTNTYNAAGKRLKRVEKDKTTRFYYMGEALLFTTSQDLVMTSENVVNTGGQIIASKRFAVPGVEVTDPFAGQYYFYRYDVRGSVTDILDKNAGLVKGYDYDEFGNTEEKGNESFLNDVTFTGSVSDASSGLQYMNARFYQPGTGRFLSQDSYTGNPYDPWTQHLYSYCGNNPVNMVDPTGFAAGRFAGFGNDIATTTGSQYAGKITEILVAQASQDRITHRKNLAEKNKGRGNEPETTQRFVDRSIPWYDRVPYSDYTVPTVSDIITFEGSTVASASLSGTEEIAGRTVYSKYYVNSQGMVVGSPVKQGVPVVKSPRIAKAAHTAGKVLTAGSLILDLGNTWTENNHNTVGQRIVKSGIQVAGTALGFGLGWLLGLAIAATPLGWFAGAVATVVGSIATGWAIDKGQNLLYDAWDIE